jgi:DNA-directed RNA polymerase subunit beta'
MEELVSQIYKLLGNYRTAQFLDELKTVGFYFAMRAGITVGIEDVMIPEEKQSYLDSAFKKTQTIQSQYEKGVITDGERYNKIIDIWTHTTSDVADKMFQRLRSDRQGFNPIFMMADSGARLQSRYASLPACAV